MKKVTGASKRDEVIVWIKEILAKAGFYLVECTSLRSMTFDIIARRDRDLLLIKILRNVDGFSRENAVEMKRVASALDGKPIIIGLHSGGGVLEDGIVYSRFGIPIITPETIRDEFLDGVPPFIIAEPGGLYVRIDGEMLRTIREEMAISLGALSEIAGVSRRAIQMYEGGMKAMIDVAQRLEEFFNRPFVLPLEDWRTNGPEQNDEWTNDFDEFTGFDGTVYRMLSEIGYSVLPTKHSVFDALTKDRKSLYIAWLGEEIGEFKNKFEILDNIIRITERNALIFVERKTDRDAVKGIPVVDRDNLLKLQFPEELAAYAQERRPTREDVH
ncbi:MAG: transcriptional regulator [Thermoplasmata archaeon]|uniref:Putative HTH-type transcriptional regulatory protein KIY12_01960 n=1 Tax=Candidatus Sysuiplasma superficiale TaxID=2823368 RepID=A0A8J7YMG2_9ARCH|nr:transcriptional regulator [Candidatus Sysuiplasma superficiale]